MPEISRFFGIIIRMYYSDHGAPHLHAEYQRNKAVIDFLGNVHRGTLGSKTALRLVREWIDWHAEELQDDWDLAREGEDLKKINPLD